MTQLVLHVGLHKTGTTSLQHSLLASFGSETPTKIWYPIPDRFGPGHAEYSFQTLGMHNYPKDPSVLQQLFAQAEANNSQAIIISSEEFARAYTLGIDSLRTALQNQEVTLFFTISDVRKRITSIWQELVKHQFTKPLQESTNEVFTHCSLQSDLYSFFINKIQPSKCVSIISVRQRPNVLHDRFYAAIQQVTNTPRAKADSSSIGQPANPSLGFYEAEFLLQFNAEFTRLKRAGKFPKPNYMYRRTNALKMFLQPAWKEKFDYLPIHYPPSWTEKVESLANSLSNNLAKLEASGLIQLYGDLSELSPTNDQSPNSAATLPIITDHDQSIFTELINQLLA